MLLWNLWLKWIFDIFSFLAFRGNRVLIVQEGDMHICILEIMRYRFLASFALLGCSRKDLALCFWVPKFSRDEHQSEEKFSATSSKPQAAKCLQLLSCCSTCQLLYGWSKNCQFSMKEKKGQSWQYTKLIAFEHWWAVLESVLVPNKTQRFPVCLILCHWKPRLY